jgi:hypothetical protein
MLYQDNILLLQDDKNFEPMVKYSGFKSTDQNFVY